MKKTLLGFGATLVCSFLTVAPAHSGSVVEYYNATLDHYFNTSYGPEIQALDSGVHKGWARTGLSFQTFDAGSSMYATSSPVCRFYGNPAVGLDSHFYSASLNECDDVKKKFATEWLLEAEDLFRVHPVNANTGACPSGTKAVYRLYNKRPDVNHRYTTDPAVVDAMLAKEYVLEGDGNPARPVAFCAADIAAPPPPAGAPVCAVSKSSQFAVVGTPVTLTATCTGSPTSYAWINCNGSGKTCTVNATAPGTANYAVVATNSVATSAQAAISLNWQSPASAAPVCQISANTTTPRLGAPLVLTANCSQSPANYQWMGCSALLIDACNLLSECSGSSSTCSPIGTQAGAVHYALRAVNSAGTSPKVGLTVEWGGSATQPPPTVDNRPVCSTIEASSMSPAVNTTLTLTAFCTNSPSTFVWSGCSSTTSTCTTTEASAVTRTYSVSGTNASGTGSPYTMQIAWQQPPTSTPVCTVTASTPTPYVNDSVTLKAACTQSPQSWQWSVPTCSSSSDTCQTTSTVAGPVTYKVAATNVIGGGATSQPVTVTWTTPPPGGVDYCSSYSNVTRIDLPWDSQIDSYPHGGFAAGGVLVGRLVVPANATATTFPGTISLVEFAPDLAPTERLMSLSSSACDFRGYALGSSVLPPSDPLGVSAPLAWSGGFYPNISFQFSSMNNPRAAKLVPGKTYYVNVRNLSFSTGSVSCQTASCNVRMTMNAPR